MDVDSYSGPGGKRVSGELLYKVGTGELLYKAGTGELLRKILSVAGRRIFATTRVETSDGILADYGWGGSELVGFNPATTETVYSTIPVEGGVMMSHATGTPNADYTVTFYFTGSQWRLNVWNWSSGVPDPSFPRSYKINYDEALDYIEETDPMTGVVTLSGSIPQLISDYGRSIIDVSYGSQAKSIVTTVSFTPSASTFATDAYTTVTPVVFTLTAIEGDYTSMAFDYTLTAGVTVSGLTSPIVYGAPQNLVFTAPAANGTYVFQLTNTNHNLSGASSHTITASGIGPATADVELRILNGTDKRFVQGDITWSGIGNVYTIQTMTEVGLGFPETGDWDLGPGSATPLVAYCSNSSDNAGVTAALSETSANLVITVSGGTPILPGGTSIISVTHVGFGDSTLTLTGVDHTFNNPVTVYFPAG